MHVALQSGFWRPWEFYHVILLESFRGLHPSPDLRVGKDYANFESWMPSILIRCYLLRSCIPHIYLIISEVASKLPPACLHLPVFHFSHIGSTSPKRLTCLMRRKTPKCFFSKDCCLMASWLEHVATDCHWLIKQNDRPYNYYSHITMSYYDDWGYWKL